MEIKGIGINVDSKRVNGRIRRFDEELRIFEKFGFDYAEISPHGVDGIIHGKINSRKIDDIVAITKKHNLKYTVHAPDVINLKDIFNKKIQYRSLKATIDFANHIGSEIVVYHCGKFLKQQYGIEEDIECEQRENEIDNLKQLADYARMENVKLAIENTSQSARSIIELIKRVDKENVGMTLDVGHLYLWHKTKASKGRFLDEINEALNYAIHMHVHDNFGEPEVLYGYSIENIDVYKLTLGIGDLHMPIGWGNIPYKEVFELIKEHDYSGVIIEEINSWQRYSNALKDIPGNIRRLFNGERVVVVKG